MELNNRSAVDRQDRAYAGQAVYNRRTLSVYDAGVVGLSNTLIWRCPARRLREQYDRHVTGDHLDVGPGSGYYLDHCRFPRGTTKLALMDANADVLQYAAARLERYEPQVHVADVLKPIHVPRNGFRSIGLNYLLHCLPSVRGTKAVVFDHLIPLAAPEGVIFGSTILGRGPSHDLAARALMRVYNSKGIFSNQDDDLEGLERALAARFDRFELDVVGSVALFAAWPT